MRRRRVLPAAAVLALILGAVGGLSTAAGAIGRDFDHPASHDTSQQFAVANVQREDTPNDPNYDQSEPDSLNGTSSTDLYSERFDLFGFPSQLTRMTALYADGLHMGQAQISGFNAAGAWKQTRGDGDTVVAILDTGVQWASQGLRDQVHLNTGELPLPEDATGATHPDAALGGYDLNGNGRVDVDDYAHDPRVLAVKPAGESLITAHDLIVAFSDGIDEDHNGFVDDIAGWNFFDNNNDPTDLSSYFSAHNHGSGRASDAVESGNDRQGSLGVCPSCEFMPIRTWDTFVSDGNTFGMGILYATDNGASVIEGANGSLYHSAFAEAASNYAYDHGVVQTFSGNDLNTPDHNYPAAYGHTMLIEGTVPDTIGLGQEYPAQVRSLLETLGVPLGSQVPVGTYFRGANTTQFGGKSSISMEGTTGSQNTGKAAGAAALVIAAAHEVGIKLRPDETRELLEQTAESVSQADTLGTGAPDFSQTGWSPHFGWGRVNLGAAVAAAINQDTIPPEAAIDSPDWYAPLTGSSVQLGGMARSRFTGQFHYVVEWGVGQAPTSWTTVRSGDASGTVTDLGSINLADVRSALANFTPPADPGSPTFSPTSPNPLSDEFTVRLTVTAGSKRLPGVDRRVFTTFTDPTLAAGFPKRLGTGGESDIRFADLNGDGVQELVVPTEDGTVHAYEPDGSELAGWPVHTSLEWQATGHADAPGFAALADVPPLEAPRGPTIADLDGDGTMETVVAAGVHIYVFEPDGSLRPGFPVASDFNFCGPARESQQLHHPKCGFLASPSLARLEGGHTLDIVEPSLDGHLYAWRPDGSSVPGYPIAIVDPNVPAAQQDVAESIQEVAVGDLNGDGKDDLVVADNEEYGPAAASTADLPGLAAQGLADLLGQELGGSTRLYAINGPTGKFLPGWPVSLNGALQTVLPFIGPGADPAILNVAGSPVVLASSTGGAIEELSPTGSLVRDVQQASFGPGSDAIDHLGGINLFESTAVGDLLGTGSPDVVKYEYDLAGVVNLAATGQNVPWSHLLGAWDATTGVSLPAYPTITDDFQFLSSSLVA